MQETLDPRDKFIDPALKPHMNMTAVIDIGSNSVRLVVFDGPLARSHAKV